MSTALLDTGPEGAEDTVCEESTLPCIQSCPAHPFLLSPSPPRPAHRSGPAHTFPRGLDAFPLGAHLLFTWQGIAKGVNEEW